MGIVRSTTKNDKQPKHGKSHLIVTPDAGTPSGGDKQQHRVAKTIKKNTGLHSNNADAPDYQNPKAQTSRRIKRVDDWCRGAKDYK